MIRKGTLTIGRPSNPGEDEGKHTIRIVLKHADETPKVAVIELSAEDFALALTGRSEVPVEIEYPPFEKRPSRSPR